jgi:hypothetical protein
LQTPEDSVSGPLTYGQTQFLKGYAEQYYRSWSSTGLDTVFTLLYSLSDDDRMIVPGPTWLYTMASGYTGSPYHTALMQTAFPYSNSVYESVFKYYNNETFLAFCYIFLVISTKPTN